MSKPVLNASARLLYEEAQRQGITCTTFGDKQTVLMEKDDKRWYTRGSRSSFQSSVGKTIADNKELTKKILHHYQLPTANFVIVKANDVTTEQVSQLSYPVVVKPISGMHGRDVFVNRKNPEEVVKTLDGRTGKWVVEEMYQGIEYRVVCIGHKFVAAAFRKPAHVVGDGQITIQGLVNKKNDHPWRGDGHGNNLTTIKIDEEVERNLTEIGMTVESIPEKGQEIALRKTANLSTGGEAWDVTAKVCKENKELFEKIAQACDLNTLGIDIMCQDLSTPIVDQANAGVIEVNASPGLRMHHFPMQGEPVNIAKAIIDFVKTQA